MVTFSTKEQSFVNQQQSSTSSVVIQINPGEQTAEASSRRVSMKNSLTMEPNNSIKNATVEGQQVNLTLTKNSMSYRLGRRKILHKRLMIVNDFACLLGLFGIILMIIVNEINFTKVHDADNVGSWVLKLCISGSTLVLLILIFLYHKFALQLHCNQNGLADWRIGLTRWKVLNIIIELVICVIHPLPREIKDDETLAPSSPYSLSYTSIDVGLGIPMFLRLYLICRTLLLHSHLMRDTVAQSLGSFNRVPMNFLFLMKTFLEQSPARCLIIFCGMAFFIGSWCLRACNYTNDLEHFTIGNSMWLFLVTYTTVGYGDLYPSSTSGRVIAALIGLVGLMSSALLIAVITQKLAFRREEKYVHTFVLNIELAKTRREQAANIIKFAFRVWLLKRENKTNTFKYLTAQRKLLFYVGAIQSTKKSQTDLIDNCVGLHELMTVQRSTNQMMNTALSKIVDLRREIKTMEQKMLNFNIGLETLQKSVDVLSEPSTSKL